MRDFCRICGGVGTVNTPYPAGTVMSYSGPNGESWPQMLCPNCGGAKVIGTPDYRTDYMSDDYLTRREEWRAKMKKITNEFAENNKDVLEDLAKNGQ